MLRKIAAVVLCSTLMFGCASNPAGRSTVRLDATSVESAETSYSAMMMARSPAEQQQLALAVLALNMEGVTSAYEVVGNPELQSPSIGRIRAKVAGMSAEEIIARAAENPSVRLEVMPGQ